MSLAGKTAKSTAKGAVKAQVKTAKLTAKAVGGAADLVLGEDDESSARDDANDTKPRKRKEK